MITIGLILVALFLFAVSAYNRLVGLRNQVDNAFAGIDVQLKKRYDLIPNLVESVKGYMKHEENVLSKLVELRNTPYNQLSDEQKNQLDKGIGQFMQGFRVTVEQYPDLKASANMIQLQSALNETEEQLSAARRSFNAAVMTYNTSIQTFPNNLFAGLFGFTSRTFFEAAAQERENVQVKF